jgi:hypothetical protein
VTAPPKTSSVLSLALNEGSSYLRGHSTLPVVSMRSRQVAIASGDFFLQIVSMSQSRSALLTVCATLCSSLLCFQTAWGAGEPTPRGESSMHAAATTTKVHPVLVELFTSEGCSSCPPADALLQRMDESQPIAGAQLIVLSEHVDYWDRLGWRDPYSSADLTDRQSSYVRALGLATAYTPQFIVDGTVELKSGDQQDNHTILEKAAGAPAIPVRIGSVTVDGGSPTVMRTRIEADGSAERHNADVYVAVALDRAESQVLRGENAGRRLSYVAVVQQIVKVGKLKKGENFGQDVQLKLKPGTDPNNVRLIAFVQEPGPGRLLGAALRMPAK